MLDSTFNFFGLNAKGIVYTCVIVAVVGLIGAQVWLRYSEKMKLAQNYLESNTEFLQTVGEIEGYGLFITHSVEKTGDVSYLGLSVRGSKDNVRVRIYFVRDRIGQWRPDQYVL